MPQAESVPWVAKVVRRIPRVAKEHLPAGTSLSLESSSPTAGTLPSRSNVTSPHHTVTCNTSAGSERSKQMCAAPQQHPSSPVQAGEKPQAPEGQPRGDPCCWDCFLPFPVDGGHPQFSHRHLDPSCKQRHHEETAPGVADSNSSSH